MVTRWPGSTSSTKSPPAEGLERMSVGLEVTNPVEGPFRKLLVANINPINSMEGP